MKERAIEYEYIIRVAHKVGRLGIPAAHADTFRGLEKSFVIQRDNKDTLKESDLKFNYAFYCGEISTNLSNALWQFEKDHNEGLTQIDKDDLNKIEILLSKANIEQIDESIERIKSLFFRHGLII